MNKQRNTVKAVACQVPELQMDEASMLRQKVKEQGCTYFQQHKLPEAVACFRTFLASSTSTIPAGPLSGPYRLELAAVATLSALIELSLAEGKPPMGRHARLISQLVNRAGQELKQARLEGPEPKRYTAELKRVLNQLKEILGKSLPPQKH